MVHKITMQPTGVSPLIDLIDKILKRGEPVRIILNSGYSVTVKPVQRIRIINNNYLEILEITNEDKVIIGRISIESICAVLS